MWFTDITPSDVTFKEELGLSDYAQVLLVDIRGHTCVMKVHRNEGPGATHPKREINVHACERKAYERLAQHGLCDRGLVPKFYGVIENMDIDLWQPLLVQFLNDWWCDYPPNAIIMEYIPGMQRLWLDNYSPKRAEGFLHQIKEIHKAGILHDDPHPRNMMVFGDDPDRVMWIDFDRAQVDDGVFYTSETLQEMLDEEDILVAEVGPMIENDIKLGRIDQCGIFC